MEGGVALRFRAASPAGKRRASSMRFADRASAAYDSPPRRGSCGRGASRYAMTNITRNASAATHMRGWTSRPRPCTSMITQYEMNPKPMPLVME